MVSLTYITEEERQKVAIWIKQLDRTESELTADERMRWINLLSPETKSKFKTGSGILEYWIQSFNAQLMKNLVLGPRKEASQPTKNKQSRLNPDPDTNSDDGWDIFANEKPKEKDDSGSDTPPWDIFD
jgi:hypothetical protein